MAFLLTCCELSWFKQSNFVASLTNWSQLRHHETSSPHVEQYSFCYQSPLGSNSCSSLNIVQSTILVNKDWCMLIQTKRSRVLLLCLVQINVHQSLVECTRLEIIQEIVANFHQWDFVCKHRKTASCPSVWNCLRAH